MDSAATVAKTAAARLLVNIVIDFTFPDSHFVVAYGKLHSHSSEFPLCRMTDHPAIIPDDHPEPHSPPFRLILNVLDT
ncbi:hypothetical protein GCM10008915_02220 [Bifidobacterium pullorum subsp. gallinarum]